VSPDSQEFGRWCEPPEFLRIQLRQWKPPDVIPFSELMDAQDIMPRLQILIADDEEPARFALRRALAQPDYRILEAADGTAALELMRTELPDLVFLDLQMPQSSGLDVLRKLGPEARQFEIIVLTASDSVAAAVECIRLGAADFVTKPYELEQVRAIARRVVQRVDLQQKVVELQSKLDLQQNCSPLVGVSRPMQQLYQQMTKAARSPVDLLIRGETGTGKELIAREIHRLSDRAGGPFVAVNTAAIPESLTESELFGHVRGAFTGADGNRSGVFEQAHGGTLFLDEIGDMPGAAQSKILRALQERAIQPVGSQRSVSVNVRIISATHQDLEEAMTSGSFRPDLFYRLKGVELRVPPLRSRREDIVVLANHFLERRATESNSPRLELAPSAVDALLTYPWPGNVRELEHAILRAATMSDGPQIEPADLDLATPSLPGDETQFSQYVGLPLSEAKSQIVEALERTLIAAALDRAAGNISEAARQLGMHRQSLQQKLSQLDLRK
jgi:DNA-binding NtrC family response regulator